VFVILFLIFAFYGCLHRYKRANAPSCSKRFNDALAEAQAAVSASHTYDEKPASIGNDYVSADDFMTSINNGGGTITNTSVRREKDPKPYNGQYAMAHLDSVGSVVRGSLNLRFVERSAGNNTPCSYGISGMGRRLRNNETVILDGECNADGLAWWTERMPYDTVPDFTPQESDEVRTNRNLVRYMTVLSHGEFDFEKSTFKGWFYGQVHETEDLGCIPDCTVELRGDYLSFRRGYFEHTR
jgi:hypothetical protein